MNRKWVYLFGMIAILVLLQVTWWATVFVTDVSVIASLKMQNLSLAEVSGRQSFSQTREEILHEAYHRKVMFLSESVFFGLLTLLGFYLIHHALRKEARSREIQKNFIEIVTHESKTPLTALKLRLESIGEKRAADQGLGHELGLALEEVRRLASIFEKAMSLNRVERHAFTFETLAPADVVREVVRRLEPFLRARGATVTTNLDREILVKADPYGLQSSVQSLIENAVLYNDGPEKRVEVTVKGRDALAVIRVDDNGPGIPTDQRERIFERFFRGKKGNRVPGTGLGLYITKTIVEAHQGALRLVDRNGGGTRFEIELPAEGT